MSKSEYLSIDNRASSPRSRRRRRNDRPVKIVGQITKTPDVYSRPPEQQSPPPKHLAKKSTPSKWINDPLWSEVDVSEDELGLVCYKAALKFKVLSQLPYWPLFHADLRLLRVTSSAGFLSSPCNRRLPLHARRR